MRNITWNTLFVASIAFSFYSALLTLAINASDIARTSLCLLTGVSGFVFMTFFGLFLFNLVRELRDLKDKESEEEYDPQKSGGSQGVYPPE